MLASTNQPLLSVTQAIAILDAAEVNPRIQSTPLSQAINQRLAQDIVADRDYPPFDKSLMDGFAVRIADLAKSKTLQVTGTIGAGGSSSQQLEPGQAIAIMTGAPLPAQADAVVPVEDTQRQGDRVVIQSPVKMGHAIARRGSDVKAGDVVLSKGQRLGPAQVAVAASVGASTVSVFAAPRVTVMVTGEELVPYDQPPGDAQIRNSNSIMLVSLLRRLGCQVTDAGIVRDDLVAITAAIDANRNGDALFIAGGMSVGQFDFVPKALADLGAKPLISKLRIKPGKPFIFTQLGGCNIFGLPGNPVSGYVCTLRLAGRIISRLSGGSADFPPVEQARLSESLPANGGREFYQPAILTGSNIQPLQWKGSADIYTLAAANALIIRPEKAPPMEMGDLTPMLNLSKI